MKIILRYIKKYKKDFIALFLLTIILSSINGILPMMSQAIFDNGILNKNIRVILVLSGGMVLLQILRSFLEFCYETKISHTGNMLVMLEKNDIFNKVINLPMTFFDKYSPQYILSRINEINSVSNLISPTVFNFATSIFTATLALVYIFYKNVYLGIMCILFMCILYRVTDIYMGEMDYNSRKLYEQSAKNNHSIHNAILGLFTIKNLSREGTIQKDIERDIKELAQKSIQQQKIVSKGTKVTTGAILGLNSILTGAIAILVVLDRLKLADYISLVQYISLVFAPIVSLQSLKIMTKPAFVSLQRVNEMFDTTEESENKSGEAISQIKSIHVNNLNFSYHTSGKKVLESINLHLGPKDKLALIGKNGSGKTTFVKILLGYYQVDEKSILINGFDINRIRMDTLRQCIGFVPQNIFLFEMSILENIRMGNTDMDRTTFSKNLNEIIEYGFLHGLDINAIIVDNGKNLSKGQIQQIAIARVLVRTHSLYIFDEATSYLDKEAKEALHNFLKNKVKENICIFICHDNDFDDIANKQFLLQ